MRNNGKTGNPEWVHVSSTNGKNRNQIGIIDHSGFRELDLKSALRLGN